MNNRSIAIACAATLACACVTSSAIAGTTMHARNDPLARLPWIASTKVAKHAVHPAPVNPVCLSPEDRTSNNKYQINDPGNSVILLNIGAGNAMTGASVEATVEAFAPSWLSNSEILYSSTDFSDDNALISSFSPFWNPGVDQISSVGLDLFSDYGLPNVVAGSDGMLRIEWFDRDIFGTNVHLNPNAVWSNAARPRVCQGLYIACTDQAACDAAVLAAGGVFSGPLPAASPLPINGKIGIGMLISGLATIVFRKRKYLLRKSAFPS
jgi:hypothetical protein